MVKSYLNLETSGGKTYECRNYYLTARISGEKIRH